MTRLFTAAFVYLVAGVAGGVYYREFTKALNFTSEQYTQLSVVHTHLLALGFLFFLIVLGLEKVFTVSASKLFGWFFWVYNAGLVLTVTLLVVHGTQQVLGVADSPAISGIAGLGHITLTAGLILFMLALKSRLGARSAPAE